MVRWFERFTSALSRAHVLKTLGLMVLALVATVSVNVAQAKAQVAPVFKAVAHTQEGEKKKERAVRIRYDESELTLLPSGGGGLDAGGNVRKQDGAPVRSYPYDKITAAEYSFGKSPRVAAALLVSPLFLFSSSKSHWLTVKTDDDYALLRLDKSNYKLVIAELEKRAKVKVESLGEDK